MKILIVEDNPVSARALEILLKKDGYTTAVAKSGTDALAQLRRSGPADLIITDVMMPEMNGLELIRALKANDAWSEIPVIVSTAVGDMETVKEALAWGCRDYLRKPINADQLRSKVRKILGDEKQVLKDPAQVMKDLGLDQNAYCEIAEYMSEQVRQLIQQLEAPSSVLDAASEASWRGRPTTILEHVTNLLESAALIGAERLQSSANRLLSAGNRSAGAPSASDVQDLLEQLKALLAALEPVIKAPKTSE